MINRIRNILHEAVSFEDRSNINDNFWKWFGKSPLKDSKGNPMIFYHGTKTDFSSFNVEPPVQLDFPVFYFTPQTQYAEIYTGINSRQSGGNILPVFLNCKKIFDTRKKKHKDIYINALKKDGNREWEIEADFEDYFCNNRLPWWFNWDSYKIAYENKFDGIFIQERETFESVGVFSPFQIKSIFNQGTWNPNDQDIMK
jgi:hypothetical protein